MLGDERAVSQAALDLSQEVAKEMSLSIPTCPLYHRCGFVSMMWWLDGEVTRSPLHTCPCQFCLCQWLRCRKLGNKSYVFPENFINENV